MLSYIFLCLITILSGRGILRLAGIRNIDVIHSWYLAPIITLSIWAVILYLGISWHFTVKQLSYVLWPLTFIFMLFGLPSIDLLSQLKKDKSIILITFVGPIILLAPAFYYGLANYSGSPALDGWSYTAFAAYLWNYKNGFHGGLAPLYQYAAHLSHTRFLSGALLGFYSPIFSKAGDPQSVVNLFLAFNIFLFASSCAFISCIFNLTNYRIYYLAICIFSGWLLCMLCINNYDNSLILGYMPILAGLSYIISPKKIGWSLILAAIITAVIVSYPEIATFILFSAFLFFVQRLLNDKAQAKALLILLITTSFIVLLLILPTLKDIFVFIKTQFYSSQTVTAARPGEGFFPHLLNPATCLASYLGFFPISIEPVGNHFVNIIWIFLNIIALISIALMMRGLTFFFNKNNWALFLTVSVLIFGSILLLTYSHYDYGSYKLILLNWWAFSFLVIIAIKHILQNKERLFKYIFLSLFGFYIVINISMIFQIDKFLVQNKRITTYRKLETLPLITGSHPILVSMNDVNNYDWALYFLKNTKIYLTNYLGYSNQPWVVPFMQESMLVDLKEVKYLLTDTNFNDPKFVVWQVKPFSLIDLNHKIIIANINNPNGVEVWGDSIGFWIGNTPTVIYLFSAQDHFVKLSGIFSFGPSNSTKKRTLLITSINGVKKKFSIAHEGYNAFKIFVKAGLTTLTLESLDKVNVKNNIKNDRRIMLLGMKNLKIE